MTRSLRSPEPSPIAAALAYLGTFVDWEQAPARNAPAVFDLGRITRLLERLGNPHRGRPAIHVTGTKGKGSVVHFADAILRAHGLRPFRFVSPHVEKLNERIAIGGADLTDDQLAALVESIRPAVDALVLESPQDAPTFFEFMTAAGFWAARQSGADADVVEVGLGGRLDSTNVIDPEVSVITSIDLDHTRVLGTTHDAIAAEKAGIIKAGRPVLVGLRPGDPGFDAILARARAVGAPMSHIGAGIDVAPAAFAATRAGWPGVRFSGSIGAIQIADAVVPGGGVHQAGNAILAIGAAARILAAHGKPLDVPAALEAIETTVIPARAEPFGSRVRVVLDGAHTAQSCAALAELARWFLSGRRVVLLGGLTSERSARALFAPFRSLADRAVFAPIPSPRSADPADAAREWRELGGSAETAATATAALDLALRAAGREGGVVVAGSFYLAGELRPLLRQLD